MDLGGSSGSERGWWPTLRPAAPHLVTALQGLAENLPFNTALARASNSQCARITETRPSVTSKFTFQVKHSLDQIRKQDNLHGW